MSGDEPKVNVKVSRMLYDFEYEALIERKAAARKRMIAEEKKTSKKDAGKK